MRLLIALALIAPITVAAQDRVVPRAGMTLTGSTTFAPGAYRLAAARATDSALITVRGSDVVIDLTGVRLIGAPESADPDRAAGVAILVDGGSNVTIMGGSIRGYKIAILARGTRNLRIAGGDLSFNWKPRLYSIVEHESLADWLSFHQNEKSEWLRFGAAIYLDGVRGGEITGVTAQQGMNGLLMTGTDSMLVWNNDFSFNSGLGIGLYRSDHNRIMHNRVEYNVRGYSEGFYRRGQDSAGILLYQQSDSNVVAYNNATHSGDGLFLWAGQHTMDTGQGGANDNLFFGNDFSWAPTNAMEATFSRNTFVFNRAVGSDYGLWGGYSFNSLVLANYFERNRIGLAIEHGQENRIVANVFRGDSTAIQLWANRIEPGDWGYPKHRDTRSRDYEIRWNHMTGARVAFRVSQTGNLDARANLVSADTLFASRGDTTGVRFDTLLADPPDIDSLIDSYRVPPLKGAEIRGSEFADVPRSSIIVDEWGPYDWRSPRLWPADSSLATPLRLRVLGPAGGRWRLVHSPGARTTPAEGSVGDTIVVTPDSGSVEDWTVTLDLSGVATRSPRGVSRSATEPYRFSYSRFDAGLHWMVTVFAWNDSTHPLDAREEFSRLLRNERDAPTAALRTRRLDFVWYRPTVTGWPQERAGVFAETMVVLPPGEYALRTISDDGIRVRVDGQAVIDDWSIHESRVHEAAISPGRHHVTVEYFQRDGWTELRAEIVKRR